MDPVRIALLAGLVPAAVAAAVLLLVRRLRRGREDSPGVGPALAAGYLAGHLGVAGIPRGLPAEAWQWLPAFALAGAGLWAVEARTPVPPAWLRWGLRLALASFAAWVTVLPRDRTLLLVGGLAAGTLLLALVLDGVADRAGPATFPWTLPVVAAAAAASLVVSGTMLVGQLGASLGAAAGACLVAGWRLPSVSRGAVPTAAVLLAALLANGVLFAELPVPAALLLAAAPLGAWVPEPLLGRRGGPRRALAIRTALVALAAGSGVAVAVAASPPMDY